MSAGPETTAHARLVAQIWADAGLRPELARAVRARHAALRDHLAARIAAEAADDAPPEVRPDVLAEFVLAAMIGYAALVNTEYAFDADGFANLAESVVKTLGNLPK